MDSGFQGNTVVTWSPPKVNVHVWSDASPWGEGAVNSHGDYFQCSWTETESCQHINLLEIRATREGIRVSQPTGDGPSTYRQHHSLHLHQEEGGTHSLSLCKESLCFWQEMVSRDVHILDPFWLSSSDNLEADFLSCQALVAWDFQLSHQLFRQVCCHFQVMPTLDAFATSRTNLLPRYMTWDRDESVVGQNCLHYLWDPVTWLFPPVPLLSAVLWRSSR